MNEVKVLQTALALLVMFLAWRNIQIEKKQIKRLDEYNKQLAEIFERFKQSTERFQKSLLSAICADCEYDAALQTCPCGCEVYAALAAAREEVAG